jgi:hypothetical protein
MIVLPWIARKKLRGPSGAGLRAYLRRVVVCGLAAFPFFGRVLP